MHFNDNEMDMDIFGNENSTVNPPDDFKMSHYFNCKQNAISKVIIVDRFSLISYVNNVLKSENNTENNILTRFHESDKYVYLYDYLFHKNTALISHTEELFNLTYSKKYELENNINSQIKIDNNNLENIIQFFNYIIYHQNSRHYDKNNLTNIYNDLYNLKLSLQPLKEIKNMNIVQHTNCNHYFHLCLNINLYYLMITYKHIQLQRENEDLTQFTQYISEINNESGNLNCNINTFKNDILKIMIELIELTLKSFNKINSVDDLTHLSPFKCNCIIELWIVIKQFSFKINNNNDKLFWDNLNYILELMENISDENKIMSDDTDEVPTYINCSKPYLFMIWLLKHFYNLDIKCKDENEECINRNDCKLNFKSDIEFCEKIIKKLTSKEDHMAESDLRMILILLDNIISHKEQCKPDIIITLWEYFHKRLNSTFTTKDNPFAYNVCSLNDNKTVHRTLEDIENIIGCKKQNTDINSYILFLKILGKYLIRTNHEQRIWNQIKGRIYSKFSLNKLSTLTNQGIKNLINLFIILFYVKGNQELNKIQTIINSISSIKKSNQIIQEIILKTDLCFILINIKNNISIDLAILNPILNIVELSIDNIESIENENIIKIYLETVQDIVNENEDLSLGQHLFFAKWFVKIINNRKISIQLSNLIYNILEFILSKLKIHQPIEKDSPLELYYNFIMDVILPNIKIDFNINKNNIENLSKFLHELTLFNLKGGINYKNKTIKLLNMLIITPNISLELKINYVNLLISNEEINNFKLSYFIPNVNFIITQCYMFSLIMNLNESKKTRHYVETYFLADWKNKYLKLESETNREITAYTNNSDDELMNFLNTINYINNNINDVMVKTQFHNDVTNLFSIEDTLKQIIQQFDLPTSTKGTIATNHYDTLSNTKMNSTTIMKNVFKFVGNILNEIGLILYKKSKPNNQLQCFIDTLLLFFQIRSPEYKLTPSLTHSMRESFYLFINSLIKLDPNNDSYINRTIKELINIYLPKLINRTNDNNQFSFIKCFNMTNDVDIYLYEIITNLFLRKKCKISDSNTYDGVVFLHDLLDVNKNNISFVRSFIKCNFEILFNNFINLNDIDVCKTKIKLIIKLCFIDIKQQNDEIIKNNLIIILTKISNENLAFNFNSFFNLLIFLLRYCSNIILHFRKNILEFKIKNVEMKRGIAYDKVLRGALDELDRNIKKVFMIQ